MNSMKKILFITGTRADYGKIKPLDRLGRTYREVLKDNYKNTYVDFSQANTGVMSFDLGNVISNLTNYCRKIEPDMIVIHGDRIDALAGAVVGALNNIIVVHIEGGELSGTIDESIRHANTKLAHLHMVCNQEAKNRLLQLGEEESRIFVTGSPDIDIMVSDELPTIEDVKKRYEIEYDRYAICMYHPVTTEVKTVKQHIRCLVDAMLDSEMDYVVVYPNNDLGSDEIIEEYERLNGNPHFRVFPSLRFEYFLTLLKNANFMIGNSSAGIRETGVYGVPSIDVGTRQRGRYSEKNVNLQHVEESYDEIKKAITRIDAYRKKCYQFGKGNSAECFMRILHDDSIWNLSIQKRFIDMR